MENLPQHIESLIFSSETALTKEDVMQCLLKLSPDTIIEEAAVVQALSAIADKFKSEDFSFELRVIGGGYQFFTKPKYFKTVGILIGQKEKKRLSSSALETLSIIAYKGPATKGDCEKIRGVNCDYSIDKLLEKELIEIAGRREEAHGKPVLYRISPVFLDYFGINSTDELPKLKDVLPTQEENTIGDPSPAITT